MTIRSMTGFGRGEALAKGIKVEAELSSVNRRQFDVRINLPRELAPLEPQIYKLINKSVSRGYVTGSIRIVLSKNAQSKLVSVDMDLARLLVRKLKRAAKELDLKYDLTARSLVSLPDFIQFRRLTEDMEKIRPLVAKAVKEAIGELIKMREIEGKALKKDLKYRITKIYSILDQIKKLAPKVAQKYSRSLTARLEKAGVKLKKDPALLKEIAVFADRCDISEELVRLNSHFKQTSASLNSGGRVGRPLDFLCQEMFREINTVGSKANDAAITRHVIRLKTELECIREQVQNVE
ncbi:YicC/YloC family endoribonuclease [Verrucomicrobiota bacterium]